MGKLGWRHVLYRLVWWPLGLGVHVWLWWRGRREPGYRAHLEERRGWVTVPPSCLGGLWIHAASVGEVQAALALLPRLEQVWGAEAILWTVQTPAGRDVLMARTNGQARVCYAPMDRPAAVRRFLDRAQPRALILLERELWPEWLWQCEQRAVSVAWVNARFTERSARRSGFLQRLLHPRLTRLGCVACADSASAERLAALGVLTDRLHTTGNLKFDGMVQTGTHTPLDSRGKWLVVATSTHEADERVILDAWRTLSPRFPDALLVLAPRHRPRFDDVASHLTAGEWIWARRSHQDPIEPGTQVLLLDTLGELAGVLQGARLALMGGTWATVGGHSPLEALAGACPVLMGPNVHQFPELYGAVLKHGAGEHAEAATLAQTLGRWLSSPEQCRVAGARGQTFWLSQQGAVERTLQPLSRLRGWPAQPMDPIWVDTRANVTVWWNAAATAAEERSDGFSISENARALPTGSGRGQVIIVQRGETQWLIRHYRRGGMVARWNPDRYPTAPVPLTRAMQEMTLLREMRSIGLPVPRPIAARCERRGRTYQADIIVGYLDHTRNVAQWLGERPLSPEEWMAVGRAIRQMHDLQIHHSDLNCHNILLDANGKVWLIDFDKCERRGGEAWKAGNLARLQRSLVKEATQTRRATHYASTDFAVLVSGYTHNDTPR